MSALSDQDIMSVADDLAANNEKVTQSAVRARLGRGSYSTIARALKSWRRERDGEQTASAEMPEDVITYAQRMWDVAYKQAHELFSSDRERFEHEAQQARHDAHDATMRAQQIKKAHDRLVVENQKMSNEIRELKAKLQVLTEIGLRS